MNIILEKVDLGVGKVLIPVADLKSKISGPTILITGGMDGDEYTGILAAYQLIEMFEKNSFPGRLIILPIINIPGFFDGRSLNPLDRKYPKYVFPGNEKGSPTHRLINWLDKKYLGDADYWLDLHSGAVTESLNPFVWGYETGNKILNEKIKKILSNINSEIKIFEKRARFSKSDRLGSKNCGYIVFEVGEKGKQNLKDINKMVFWVRQALGMIWNGDVPKKNFVTYFQKVNFYNAPESGLWEPNDLNDKIEKGDLVGKIYSLDKKKIKNIKAKETGKILWFRSALFVNSGDEVLATAY